MASVRSRSSALDFSCWADSLRALMRLSMPSIRLRDSPTAERAPCRLLSTLSSPVMPVVVICWTAGPRTLSWLSEAMVSSSVLKMLWLLVDSPIEDVAIGWLARHRHGHPQSGDLDGLARIEGL